MKIINVDGKPLRTMTVRDLKDFIAKAEVGGRNLDELPLHLLNLDENEPGYVTHIEFDSFDADDIFEGAAVHTLSLLAWPTKLAEEMPL